MRHVVALASAVLALACTGKDPYNPGTPLGTFHVTGKLTTNACAPPDQVPDPWEFDVRLARDSSTLYWIQGGLPVQGHLDATAHATMSSESQQELRPADPKNHVSACTMMRNDALDTTLGPDPVSSLTGTLTYSFAPTSDSDCSDQLAVAGGGFTNLPCQVGYAITAAKKP